MLVVFYAINQTRTFTPPNGYTTRYTEALASPIINTTVIDTIQDAVGASGAVVLGLSGNHNRRSSQLVALKQKTTCP